MDAFVPQDVRHGAYGQAVWFRLPAAGVKPRVKSPGRWWLKSPAHQEEHGAAVKPLRRECRMISAYLCWPARVFFVLRVRQWVRRAPGIPCALWCQRDIELQDPDANSRRGNASGCLKIESISI